MHRYSKTDRLKLIFFIASFAMIIMLGVSGVRSAAESETPPANEEASTVAVPSAEATAPAAAHNAPALQPDPGTPQDAPAMVEGCLDCHSAIEPMHETRDGKLRDGKD